MPICYQTTESNVKCILASMVCVTELYYISVVCVNQNNRVYYFIYFLIVVFYCCIVCNTIYVNGNAINVMYVMYAYSIKISWSGSPRANFKATKQRSFVTTQLSRLNDALLCENTMSSNKHRDRAQININ